MSKPKDIVSQNPKINRKIIAEYDQLEKEMQRLGIEHPKRGARYSLSPPFERISSSAIRKTN